MFERRGEWEIGKRGGVLPEGFETMAPGVRLGSLLETIDRSDLNGYEMVVLVQARARQIAHLQAEFYADVLEMAMCPLGDSDSPAERLPTIDDCRDLLLLAVDRHRSHVTDATAWAKGETAMPIGEEVPAPE